MLHDSDGEPTLPYRGRFGAPRPPGVAALALPPAPMPGRWGLRPLKAWRYVLVAAPELMLCAAVVRIGPARQAFWAVWDRDERRLHERTRLGRGRVTLLPGRLQIADGPVAVDLELAETDGVETVSASGQAYAWTRKQGGIAATGTIALAGVSRRIDARAVVDDTAGYHERHTRWRWCAGIGETADGRAVAFNLVEGVHDAAVGSERTIWVDGQPSEVPPVSIGTDLATITARPAGGLELRFDAEAIRTRDENRLLVRSRYSQPFGTFTGELAPGLMLARGLGVMEDHDVYW